MPTTSQSSLTHCHQLMSRPPAATRLHLPPSASERIAKYCSPRIAALAAILVSPGDSDGPSRTVSVAKSCIGRGARGTAEPEPGATASHPHQRHSPVVE